MKNVIAVLCLLISFAGCESSPPKVDDELSQTAPLTESAEDLASQDSAVEEPVRPTEAPASPQALETEAPASTSKPDELPDKGIYQQWAIKFNEYEWYRYTEDYDRYDCIGLENGQTYGGDLISTIIADEKISRNFSLEQYTPEYLMRLDKKVALYTQRNFNSNYFAFYVCNLGYQIDLIGAVYWPVGQKLDDDRSWELGRHLILVNRDLVKEIPDIQVLDNTATGAETLPCRASIKNDVINWKCFAGFAASADGMSTVGSRIKYHQIDLTGRVVKTWIGVED